MELPCTQRNADDSSPVSAYAVELYEPSPPEREEPLRWLLLTSERVQSDDDAWLTVTRYRRRWVIEEWHKAIKSGFKLEEAQLKTAQGIRRLAAIAAVVSLRLMQLRDAASAIKRGEKPAAESICTLPLTDPVWRKVVAKREKVDEADVDGAVLFRTLAKSGGHLGRKHDSRPGWACLWRGYRKLSLMVEGVRCVEG